MKKLLVLSVLSVFACVAYAADTKDTTTAATDTAKTNPQQEKMKACQAQAGEKKLEGKARQDYVNNCLKAKPAAEADKQKSKMAMCNEKTKGMSKPDADKARSECMKAS
ncbi:MAG TPA: PsiF family protein [Methyloceanibacter sp.]|nr:PsiF family protein [Methyloceanibacter sp.]